MGYPIHFSSAHPPQYRHSLTAKRCLHHRSTPPRIRIPEDAEVEQAEREQADIGWLLEPPSNHIPRRVDIYEGYGEGPAEQEYSSGDSAAAFTPIPPPHRWSSSPTPPPPVSAQPLISRSRSFYPNVVPTSHIVYPPTWEDDDDLQMESGDGRSGWSEWRGEGRDGRFPVTSTPILQHEGLSDHRFFSGDYHTHLSASPPRPSGGGTPTADGAVEVVEWVEQGSHSPSPPFHSPSPPFHSASPPFPTPSIPSISSLDLPAINPAIQSRHNQEAIAMQAAYAGWLRQAQSRRDRFQRLVDEQTARLHRLQLYSRRFQSQGTQP
ncbi:hypothetical protein BJ684DRAFT_15830 [Piptocephalis cylindrospora]|uniref:Uncharacterized protein n=1 Tax=Piptocephalis cylindrospora TaxID=1907219 RepID=A0A4V1IY98_9FUNG|nr:hypothetical protein BJ684DRAFT_15830 [Piptocephalis cylindrospora]|eukprot:RKP13809.1 hypothetical protein BJ684DRAFT_15830 [Piptocephalis cylindrospora]